MKKVEVVACSLPKELIEEIEEFRKSSIIPISRSVFFREAVKSYLKELKSNKLPENTDPGEKQNIVKDEE